MPTATWNDVVIAQSDQTVMVEGNHYFPPESVDRALLRPSEKTSHCPWKGTAAYYDVVVGDQIITAAAWTYLTPKPKASHIAEHVAFWGGVRVTE